ncbi:hypothetical protein BV25DRAFT_1822992 [Artomyces pyxidatus]|uniref:Uncharacterized protein n=1 Tax=Artomyces pyxidatus TaxID=48021 RepID=A0ACB8T759_9AGAM|nr:hypothetical protein BV25DRAFT_1822992 [Artomyces pyxidatus]
MEEPPPIAHTLRPHHISLLWIVMLLNRQYSRDKFHPAFLLHLYRVLLTEIAEVSHPKTYKELLAAFREGPHSDDGASTLFNSLDPHYVDFQNVDTMTNFFHDLAKLVMEKKNGDDSDLHRRSLFGYFSRRCYVSFMKLSFAGVNQLRNNYHRWVFGDASAGYERVEKDLITYDTVLLKTHADEYQWAVSDAYAEFEKDVAVSDSNSASESLRRYFEQHFHDGNDSGIRHHALLNLSRMHYLRHEFAATRKFLTEAIEISRAAGDHWGLQHCQSLLHRLPPTDKGQKPALNEIQPGLHPLEVLFDVEKLLRVSSEQPLSASFEKIIQSVALYDLWITMQAHVFDESELLSQHAVQSIIWSAAGCEKLAAIEENIVTAFSEIAGDDNNAITIHLNRAYRRARQGSYEDAIAMLLEPDIWRGLSITDYARWAAQIWHVLVLRASRRGQDRQYNDFLKPRRPAGTYNSKEYFFNATAPPGSTSIIRDPLYEVMQMRQVGQAAATVEQLLKALWHAEFQNRYGSYRVGVILLADIGLEFGLTKRSKRILEEIMPQVIDGDDMEQRGLACFTLARCLIAAGERSAGSIRAALPYLDVAEKDYAALEMFRSLADVQCLLSVLYHNLGMVKERDEAAERQLKTEEDMKKAAVVVNETWVWEVWELVCDVGAALAKR